jgi:predicted dehydrogenase
MNIGLIGCGGISGVHIPAHVDYPSANIIAVCDLLEEAMARATAKITAKPGHGEQVAVLPKSYTDYHELLADPEVEIVDICLPTDLHAPVAIAAFAAGKHVICEKPMALTVADCDRMIDAAERAGRHLYIGQCIRLWPEYVAMMQLVESGQYGKLTSAFLQRISPFPGGWFADPVRSGGAMFDLHIHDTDFIAYYFGMPTEVNVRGTEDARGVNYVMAEFRYPTHRMIYAEGGDVAGPYPFQMGFRVMLEDATIEWHYPTLKLTVYPNGGAPYEPELHPLEGHAFLLNHFLDCLAKNAPSDVITPFQARETIRLLHLEIESVRTGKPVSV